MGGGGGPSGASFRSVAGPVAAPPAFEDLVRQAERIAAALAARGETVAVAESSAGGLISAALLAVPGASAYFLGGGVVYTAASRMVLLDMPREAIRRSSESAVLDLAHAVRTRLNAVWGLAESGAAGPNAPAGFTFVAVSGPIQSAHRLETGLAARAANMALFAEAALGALDAALGAAQGARFA